MFRVSTPGEYRRFYRFPKRFARSWLDTLDGVGHAQMSHELFVYDLPRPSGYWRLAKTNLSSWSS